MGNDLTTELAREMSLLGDEILEEVQRLMLATQSNFQQNATRRIRTTTKATYSCGATRTRMSYRSSPHTQAYVPPEPSAPPLNRASAILRERRPPQPYSFVQNELGSLTRSGRLYSDLGRQATPPQRPSPPQRPASSNGFVVNNTDGIADEARSDEQEEPSLSCACCRRRLRGAPLYQCSGGHSSCASCRAARRICGVCARPVTDMRSFALEVFIAQMKIHCLNAGRGCKRMLTMDEEEEHARECPFGDVRCPASAESPCPWTGEMSSLAQHFKQCHRERCVTVATEYALPGSTLRRGHTLVFLLTVGVFNFVLRIEKTAGSTLRMAVQLLGTSFGANKWTYELHVYSKAEPHREYSYGGFCSEIGAPAVPGAELADAYVASFLDRDELVYKVYVKKQDEDDHDSDREPSPDGAGEPSLIWARRLRSRRCQHKNKRLQK